jgi:hypothetical protein
MVDSGLRSLRHNMPKIVGEAMRKGYRDQPASRTKRRGKTEE